MGSDESTTASWPRSFAQDESNNMKKPIMFVNLFRRIRQTGVALLVSAFIGLANARADCTNILMTVSWDNVNSQIVTDNGDTCADSAVITPLVNHYCYVGGVFGYAVGLKANGAPNQSNIRAYSICKVYVNPTTGDVTCYQLATGAMNSIYGVAGNGQIVNAIWVSSYGDVFVGGKFWQGGGNPYCINIACYKYPYGWQSDTIFSAYYTGTGASEVDAFTWDGTNNRLIVEGSFNYVVTQHPSPYTAYNTSLTASNEAYLNNTSSGFNYVYWTIP